MTSRLWGKENKVRGVVLEPQRSAPWSEDILSLQQHETASNCWSNSSNVLKKNQRPYSKEERIGDRNYRKMVSVK